MSPSSPITPPPVFETRSRRKTVGGMRREDLYSLFPDSGSSLFTDVSSLFTSSDEWDDISGLSSPMPETRPTSRSLAAPPPLPLHLRAPGSPPRDAEPITPSPPKLGRTESAPKLMRMSSKSLVMDRIEEDRPHIAGLPQEKRLRSNSTELPMAPEALRPRAVLTRRASLPEREGTPPLRLSLDMQLQQMQPPSPATPSPATPAPAMPFPEAQPTPQPMAPPQPMALPQPDWQPAPPQDWQLPPDLTQQQQQPVAFWPAQPQPFVQPQPQMPMMQLQLVTLANGQQMQVLVPLQPLPPGMAPQMPMLPMAPQMPVQMPQQPQPQPPFGAAAATAALMQMQQLPPPPPPPPMQLNGGLPWEPGALSAAARDTHGSRQLQQELSRLGGAQLQQVAEELGPQVHALAMHPFGNYVVSRMAALPALRPAVAAGLAGHVAELITHAQGSRVVQAALGAFDDHAAEALAGELRGQIKACSVDSYGSWGVCVAFERCLPQWMLDEVAANIGALAVQQQACHVVQTVLRVAAKAGMRLDGAIDALLSAAVHLPQLAAHPFANYAVQIALKHAAAHQRHALVARLLPEILTLASSKHGSNVAETLLAQAQPAELQAACELVVNSPQGVPLLVQHQFGNYVLQTLLRLLPAEPRARTLAAVRAVASDSNYGRRILARFGEPEHEITPVPASPEL